MNVITLCPHCHQKVIHAQSLETGERIILDHNPHKDGTLLPYDQYNIQGKLVTTYQDCPPGLGHRPHHATCSAAHNPHIQTKTTYEYPT